MIIQSDKKLFEERLRIPCKRLVMSHPVGERARPKESKPFLPLRVAFRECSPIHPSSKGSRLQSCFRLSGVNNSNSAKSGINLQNLCRNSVNILQYGTVISTNASSVKCCERNVQFARSTPKKTSVIPLFLPQLIYVRKWCSAPSL